MSEHESMSCGALIVGAGPAGLGCAIQLMKLINAHNEAVEKGEKQGALINEETMGVDAVVMVIEKSAAVGAHAISGAIMNPNALEELIPDYKEKGAPLEHPAEFDRVMQFSAGGARKLPITPPTMHNHGNYIISLTKMVKWLNEQFAETGQEVYATFSGQEIIYENDSTVSGIRCGDKGVNPDGTQKSNFEPGMDLMAKATVLCDGSRGQLTKQLVRKLNLDCGKNPQVYATGVKEVWELPEGRLVGGQVIHSMGYPCDSKTFGGGFIYNMSANQVAIGMITALDAKDPQIDPHKQFCKLKSHPFVKDIIKDGKMLFYGAKTLPEGGWNSVPKLSGRGFMLCGDAAGLINVPKLKGVNYAMKSGMLAAETIFESMVSGDWSVEQFNKYQGKIEESWVGKELIPFRNFRPLMKKGIFPWGMVKAGINYFTKGRYPMVPVMKLEEDHTDLVPMAQYYPQGKPDDGIKFDNKDFLFDKLTDVYNSGTTHEEKQPCHLQVKTEYCKECYEKFGAPCEAFCPAQVYNIVKDEKTGAFERIQVDFSNCVHCKTCDIRDPYQAINWVCPEGGGGPQYNNL